MSSPSPQTDIPEKTLYQGPSGISGSVSSHRASEASWPESIFLS